jgi:2'-5' RNA ligase
MKEHDGAMIAFFVPEEYHPQITAYQSLLPDADLTLPEDLHLTLYYLTSFASNLNEVKTLLFGHLAGEMAWEQGVIAEVNGFARFTGNERDAIVLLVNSPQLTDFYRRILWVTEEYGQQREHGFTPHVTLGYVPKNAKLNLPAIERQTMIFDSITVVWSGEKTTLPLRPHPLTVFKDANNQWRWLGITSSSYEDRDEEILTQKALRADVERADNDGFYGPLNWWHIKGLNLGECDFNMMLGRFLVESGTFNNETVAKAVAEKADELAFSIEFYHPPTEPNDGSFDNIVRVGRALLPQGKESNRFTSLITLEDHEMASYEEKLKQLIALTGKDTVEQLLDMAIVQQKKANQERVRYKEALNQEEFLKAIGIVKKAIEEVKKAIEEMKTWQIQQTTKEAGLEVRFAKMEQSLKELKGEVPLGVGAGYRPSQATDNIVSKSHEEDPFSTFFNGFFQKTPG